MLGGFVILCLVEGTEDRVVLSDQTRGFHQIVSQIGIGFFAHPRFFSDEVSGLVLVPDQAGVFGQLGMSWEVLDVTDFRQDPGRIRVPTIFV